MKKDHFSLTKRMWFAKPFGRQNWIVLSLGMNSGHGAWGKNQGRGFCGALGMCCPRGLDARLKEKNKLKYLHKADFGFKNQGKVCYRGHNPTL